MTEVDNQWQCPQCGAAFPRALSVCPECGHIVVDGSEPAKLLRNGELRIVRRLGGGGMSNLFLAEDTYTGKPCVVKELQAPANRKQRLVFESMFHEEASLLARVSRVSPAVPRYYDAFMDSGSFYIVLEFVPGLSLQRYADDQGGRLPIPEVLDYSSQVIAVLAALHGVRPSPVVHGDVTPANLILRPDGRVILIDFGLARVADENSTQATSGISAFGTPGYAPMEQWDGYPVPASDIFSFGATLHRLVSGRDPRAPFKGMGRVTKQDLSRLTNFPPIALLAPETPPMLETLIMQMLRRRATDRPSAREVKARLDRLAATSAPLYTVDRDPLIEQDPS